MENDLSKDTELARWLAEPGVELGLLGYQPDPLNTQT